MNFSKKASRKVKPINTRKAASQYEKGMMLLLAVNPTVTFFL